jgi:polysaccharide biosynthesis transport protein
MQDTSALKLYLQVFWRRRWAFLAASASVMGAMLLYTLTQTNVYESSLLLLISGREKAPQVVVENLRDEPASSDSLDNEVRVLQTFPVLSQAVKKLQKNYPDLDTVSLADNLSVQQLGKSGIVSVIYQDTDPDRLLVVLNQLGRTYMDFGLASRKSRVTDAIRFIERTLPEARRTLALKTSALEQFRKKNNLIDPTLFGTSLAKSLADVGEQERSTLVKIQESKALYQNLLKRSGMRPDKALAVASLNQDPIYADLLKQYQEAENQYSLEQLRLRGNAPQVQALRAKLDLRKQILKDQVQQILGKNANTGPRLNALQIAQVGQLLEAQNSLAVEQARVSALQDTRRRLEKDFKLVPTLQRLSEELERQVKVATESVDRLSSKLGEFRIIEAQESAPWKIIQPPYTTNKPVSPNLPLNLLLGGILALLAGGIAVYLREQFDSRVYGVRRVRELLGLPIIASLPRLSQTLLNQLDAPHRTLPDPDNTDLNSEATAFSEAVQYLNFNLRWICGQFGNLVVLGFTSPSAHEGKSTTIRKLSCSAQQRGLRVLLIDADLRRPTVHRALGLSNQLGLSTLLTNDLPWRRVIQRSGAIHVLTAGPKPDQVLALLDSPKLSQLMLEFRNEYDLVLVDLPPVVGTTDPLLVAPHLDGLVLVVSAAQSNSKDLLACQEALSRVQTNLLGVVCTMVEPEDMPYSAYYQDSQPQPTSIRRQLLDRFPPSRP